MTHVRLIDGSLMDLLNPAPEMVPSLRDLAETLAKINRFTGNTLVPWSVAEHSLLVASLLPARLGLYGLLHDAHEAIVGDIIGPVRVALAQLCDGRDIVADLAASVDAVIHERFGLHWPLSADDRAAVDHADRVALATEFRDICRGSHIDPGLPPPAAVSIYPVSVWVTSAVRFETRFRRLAQRAAT